MKTDPYGHGTYDKDVIPGFNAFFGGSPSSGKWNYKTVNSYSSFQSALNNNCPVHTFLHTKDEGHSVFGLGYAHSTSGTKYIFVMDGWNTYGRFVKYNYYPNVYGYKIWVS